MRTSKKVSGKASPRLVGVIHLPALPGAPKFRGPGLAETCARAVSEAKLLEREGFDAAVLENFGDVPFFKGAVPPLTVAAMAVVAAEVRQAVGLPLGINVLRNDAQAALAVAGSSGCQFIRVNVLSGVAATDQGIVETDAANLMRAKDAIERQGLAPIQVWADALVKHARTLSVDDMELAVEEVALRAGADAVIVTGATTGRAVELEKLRSAAGLKLGVPLYLGSGTTAANIASFAPLVHGVIVGSALRRGGQAGAPLVPQAVRAFAAAWKRSSRQET